MLLRYLGLMGTTWGNKKYYPGLMLLNVTKQVGTVPYFNTTQQLVFLLMLIDLKVVTVLMI